MSNSCPAYVQLMSEIGHKLLIRLTLTFHLWVIKGKVENKDKNFYRESVYKGAIIYIE